MCRRSKKTGNKAGNQVSAIVLPFLVGQRTQKIGNYLEKSTLNLHVEERPKNKRKIDRGSFQGRNPRVTVKVRALPCQRGGGGLKRRGKRDFPSGGRLSIREKSLHFQRIQRRYSSTFQKAAWKRFSHYEPISIHCQESSTITFKSEERGPAISRGKKRGRRF